MVKRSECKEDGDKLSFPEYNTLKDFPQSVSEAQLEAVSQIDQLLFSARHWQKEHALPKILTVQCGEDWTLFENDTDTITRCHLLVVKLLPICSGQQICTLTAKLHDEIRQRCTNHEEVPKLLRSKVDRKPAVSGSDDD